MKRSGFNAQIEWQNFLGSLTYTETLIFARGTNVAGLFWKGLTLLVMGEAHACLYVVARKAGLMFTNAN